MLEAGSVAAPPVRERSACAPTRPADGATAPTDEARLAPASGLTFAIDGAVRLDRAALSMLPDLHVIASGLPHNRAGQRLHGVAALRALLERDGALGTIAATQLGQNARAVRALMFDKTPATNWALGWHQDRTIVVRAQINTAGFGPWTVKAGMIHVEPPARLMADMLTMRVHLDNVPHSNAPLLIAPGSHRFGRIPETHIPETAARCGTMTCLAEVGDIWLYATPILHSSAAATQAMHRRVLQIDFSANDLPNGLEWLGL